MNKLREFIKINNIKFDEGVRNSSLTTTIGYSLYLGLTQEQIQEALNDEITTDVFILQELIRIFPYAKNHNYGKWWKSKEATKQYIF
jgi:hypothetical protein